MDNGSSDGSPELVRERFPWAVLEEPGENLGYGRAVNLVAERSDTPWLVASNADVELEPGALERLLAAGEDPRVGRGRAAADPARRLDAALGVRLRGAIRPWSRSTAGLYKLDPRARRPPADRGPLGPEPRAATVPWALGAFLLLRREAFDAVGGFDPAQWLYAEDVDLGWRLGRAGLADAVRARRARAPRLRAPPRGRPSASSRTSAGWPRPTTGSSAAADAARRIVTAALNLAGALVRRDRAWARVHRRALSGGRDGRRAEPSTPRAPEA